MLVAVEPSADVIGASFIRELRKLAPEASLTGCGGIEMSRAGLTSLFPIDEFSVMGAIDVLHVAPLAMRRAVELGKIAAERKIDTAVFIDGWAFSRLATVQLRKFSPCTTSIKFVAPQVWASRPQRVKFVHRYFDGVLTILPFEPTYFTRNGGKAEFVGNPIFQEAWRNRGDGDAFRRRHNIGDAPILAVLLGSRKSEILRLGRPFLEAARRLEKKIAGLRIVSPVAESVAELARQMLLDWPGDPIVIGAGEKYDAMAAANVALTASGTASTELAINRTPMVVAYRVDPLTAFWASLVKTTPFASIINVTANRPIIPEFIQKACNGPALASALEALFNNPETYFEQVSASDLILKELGVDGPSAANLAATCVLDWAHLGKRRPIVSGHPSIGLVP